MKRSEALYLRAVLEQAAASLNDKTASTAVTLFPRLKGNGERICAGTRINWKGTIRKAAADLWDTKENDPDHAPNLWAELAYLDGWRRIPEVITTSLAFALGECGWWEGVLYRSRVNGNIYTPAQYADNWEREQR